MPKLRISGALHIYCGFWERMKEISVGGVPKWLYMVGNLRKKKWIVQEKTKWKKERKRNRKEVEVQFELYYVKLVELMIFEKKKLCSTSL